METRAPFVIVGAFVLAAIVAVFGFVYWLQNTGGLGPRTSYRVQFGETLGTTVEVSVATDALLTTSNPSAGGVLSQSRVESLPNVANDVMDFYRLIPGVTIQDNGSVEASPAWKVLERPTSSATASMPRVVRDGRQMR